MIIEFITTKRNHLLIGACMCVCDVRLVEERQSVFISISFHNSAVLAHCELCSS